ncbi:GGDEF/EAL domain-containing response regulator [Alishewanella sp. d11]|uniref:GGDEF/EAL domain-containing response regulator n=1 Tax=Alishewanella sp. d11 TaxID=3414030 RepID=UPI003BF8F70D
MVSGGDELLVFTDDEPVATVPALPEWHILIVDDEPDVHAATKIALRGLELEGRSLTFSHAYSAAEALTLLQQHAHFAIALIDVVMETEDAGLQLVRTIRDTLKNSMLRIILRTGQPGYAPEIETIRQYDINDYKTKTELTRVRLFTSVTIAIRSYAQLQQLESSRQGLEQILLASRELGKPAGLKLFAAGLVTQLCALLKVKEECLVCAAMQHTQATPFILAAAGSYTPWMGLPLQQLPDVTIREKLTQTLVQRQHQFEQGITVYFQGANEQALAAFVDVASPLDEVSRRLLAVFCQNISIAFENLQLYLSINELAFFDSAVQLPNRHAFIASLNQRKADDNVVALIDLDNFSYINNVLDDSFGDQVLQAVASRLTELFHDIACVARVGGDLFALHGSAVSVSEARIASVFAEPFVTAQGEPLRLAATTGLIKLEDTQQQGIQILKNVGIALKQAKYFSRGQAQWYEAAFAEAARERMTLLSRLRTAFSAERLHLNFQPFINLASGDIVGAECLLRWKTEDGHFVPPDKFIPLAEKSGLMVALGEWVLRSALRWRASLKGVVPEHFRVAINVSQTQFNEPDFVAKVLQTMAEHHLTGQQIEVELTESIAVGNIKLIAERINQLRAQQISVAIDDFGTGYSSLSLLQQLKFDRLKIDRAFVSGEQSGSESLGIVKTILALAQHLQVCTIAEGIESASQQQLLASLGCEEGQGYYFSKPLDENAFYQFITAARVNQNGH